MLLILKVPTLLLIEYKSLVSILKFSLTSPLASCSFICFNLPSFCFLNSSKVVCPSILLAVFPLGNNTFKIRIAIKSKGKGKSGGARIITFLVTENREIYLLTIYDKSEFDNLDDKILKSIIESLQ